MRMWVLAFILSYVACHSVAFAQKVIVEGGEGSSLTAKMELYSRWTKSETLKAQYASFANPEVLSDFSTSQFKEVYEKQLKEMYRIVNGELIQIKAWNIHSNLPPVAPKPRLEDLTGVAKTVPVLHRVQIKRLLTQGVYLAQVSSVQGAPIASIVQFDANGESYAAGTVLEAYLVHSDLAADLKSVTRGALYSRVYQCVPDEVGKSVHVPTLKEMANEIKKGLTPLVMVPTGAITCATCEGSGVDKQKIAAAEAAAKREANQLGSSEKMYDPLGKRNTKTNRLGESKAFTAAKLKRNKPPCQACKGDGKISCEVFRILKK